MALRLRRWGAAVLRFPGRVRFHWRRSLQFRVVAVTMVLSVIVAVGLGEYVADLIQTLAMLDPILGGIDR